MLAEKYSRPLVVDKKKYFCIFENISWIRKYLDLACFINYEKKILIHIIFKIIVINFNIMAGI